MSGGGQIYALGQDGLFHPCRAKEISPNHWVLEVDTEITLDSAGINIANIKVGSPNQSKENLRFLKVLDDGTLIAVPEPTKLYKIADVDDAGSVKYYGFTDVDGGWYILKEDKSVSPNTYRYIKGSSNYPSNFVNRNTITPYDYFYNVF